MSDPSPVHPPLPNVYVRGLELLFGFGGIALITIAAVLISPGATLMGFIDYPSLILCVGVVAGFLLVSHGVVAAWRGLVIAVRGTSKNLDDVHLAVDVCDAATQSVVLAGVIGSLIGLVIMLGNMSDPSAIGPGMAVALLATFYSALLACIFVSFRFRIAHAGRYLAKDGSDPKKDSNPIPPPIWSAMILLPVLLGLHLLAFFVLMLSMAQNGA